MKWFERRIYELTIKRHGQPININLLMVVDPLLSQSRRLRVFIKRHI